MAHPPEQATSTDVHALLRHAENVCGERGVAFTAIRRQVFELLCLHQRPVGAYELLDELKRIRPKAAPVTVYRALDFLLEAGLAHKVNALNAFTACRGSDLAHKGLMLICSQCFKLIELEDRKVESSIRRSAADLQFQTSDEPVEVVGTCSDCRR